MNTEGDLECTCDIGPFSDCPVCSSGIAEWKIPSAEDLKVAQKRRQDMQRRAELFSPMSIIESMKH